MGTDPELQFLEDLAERICTEKALQAPMEVPEGIECTRLAIAVHMSVINVATIINFLILYLNSPF